MTIAAKVKGKGYNKVVRPAVMHVLETEALTKTGAAVTDRDRIRNVHISRTNSG